MASKTFTCVNCGDEHSAKMLSTADFKTAGTHSRAQALDIIEDPVCILCEEDAEDEDLRVEGTVFGQVGARTLQEAFEWDNLPIDEGLAVFISNNW